MKKRFLIIQIIAVIMLGINLIGFTYSWSQRAAVKGGYQQTPMQLTYTANVNGNKCTSATYLGTLDATSGEIIYSSTPITSLSSTDVSEGTVLYFRTDITNAAAIATNVSLFIDVTYSDSLEGKCFLSTTSPTIKRFSYPAQESDLDGYNYCWWLPVVNQYEVPSGANGGVNACIDWYVEFTASGEYEINRIILTNN